MRNYHSIVHRITLVISVLLILIIVYLLKGQLFFNKKYLYSNDGKNCVTFIQPQNDIGEIIYYFILNKPINPIKNEFRVIYIVPGEYKSFLLPKNNYICVYQMVGNAYVKFSENKSIVVLPYILIKKNKLDTAQCTYRINFTKEEVLLKNNIKNFYLVFNLYYFKTID